MGPAAAVSFSEAAGKRRVPWLIAGRAAVDNLAAYSVPSEIRLLIPPFSPALPNPSKDRVRMLLLVRILDCSVLRFCERET
jgi:hypothetical protein